jgi:PAT family acetyl-CoA transporter-like MFS transporter 1
MDGSRRRVSRVRDSSSTIPAAATSPSSNEKKEDDNKHYQQRRHRRNRRNFNDSNSASFTSKLSGLVSRTLMRGLFDESDSGSSNEEEENVNNIKEDKIREGRRRSVLGDFLDNPHTSEDVLANEGDFASGGGIHVPFLYPHHAKEEVPRRNFELIEGNGEEQRKAFILLRPFGWFKTTRDTLQDDFGSIFLLLFLYLLQGIPLGLISAIPLILQSKHVTYGQQAIFSFAYWPFSLKLLWAPIVDAIYIKRIGRRKSWMVPCQYLIGLGLLFISYISPQIIGTESSREETAPNVFMLMMIFLPLNFLAATQDIAVDGWALTMLSRKNVGYASTCNVVGQTIGFFLGNVGLLTLESKDFANKWIRSVPQDYGIVDLPGFVFFWGWVFIVSTTLVLVFKKEVDNSIESAANTTEGRVETGHVGSLSETQNGHEIAESDTINDEITLGVVDTYAVLFKIICLKPVMYMVAVLLTAKIAFAATDGMTDLKLIGFGVKKDGIASRAIFLTPLQIVLPWLLGKQTAGRRPLNVFLWAYPYRIIMGICFAALVYFTPSFRQDNGEYPYSYYLIWIVAYYFHQISAYCIFLSMMAFNAQVSDPKIGGTYMTLLNTLNNLGGNWPLTLFLSITDFFTFKNCVAKGTQTILNTCNTKKDEELCTSSGDVCEMAIDGYYISVGVCTVIGLIWYRVFYPKIQYFQRIPREEWRVIKNK